MDSTQLNRASRGLTTPMLCDACIRLGIPIRVAPVGVTAVVRGSRVIGRVLPARHYGSVDIFLEACEIAQTGDLLVIDNGGRSDEGCIGDLTALEVKGAGLAGMVVWGRHRDSAELAAIGLPVFSYGRCPAGPQELRARPQGALNEAHFGDLRVSAADFALADDDGVCFVPLERAEEVLRVAAAIGSTERKQAEQVASGSSLREQLDFRRYLQQREADPAYSFRSHLRSIGGAIEE